MRKRIQTYREKKTRYARQRETQREKTKREGERVEKLHRIEK